MVLAALTEYPHLFAAGIDVVGIADWVTFLERTSPWRRAHREREYGSLSSHREFLRSISPLHKAERISVPLLVLAGDNDPRVPLYESEQIVQRVRCGKRKRSVHPLCGRGSQVQQIGQPNRQFYANGKIPGDDDRRHRRLGGECAVKTLEAETRTRSIVSVRIGAGALPLRDGFCDPDVTQA